MKAYLNVLIACCLLIGVACKKKSSSTPATPAAPVTTGSAAIDINHTPTTAYTLDGTHNFSFTDGVNGAQGGTDNDKNINSMNSPVTTTAIYGSAFSNDSTNYFEISRGSFSFQSTEMDTTLFKQAFANGNLNYSVGPSNGIVIQHWDANGTLWSTELGTANQSGSLFTIVSNKSQNTGYQDVKIYATFNCKLYDGNGNSKTLTNGKFVGYFENN